VVGSPHRGGQHEDTPHDTGDHGARSTVSVLFGVEPAVEGLVGRLDHLLRRLEV
jgi:hypothetical protein